MRGRNSSGSVPLHDYRKEDMSSAFIIDLPQLQKYPDRALLLSVSVCVHTWVYSCASISFNNRDSKQVRRCGEDGLSHREKLRDGLSTPALSHVSLSPVNHSQQPQRLLAV